MSRYKLLCIKWTSKKNLLYNTGCNIKCLISYGKLTEKINIDMCIYMCCIYMNMEYGVYIYIYFFFLYEA